MIRHLLSIAAVLSLLIAGSAPGARAADSTKPEDEMRHSTVAESPEWVALKSLVGQWTGSFDMDGKPQDATAEVRMTGGGSALMHVLGKDTPHEMVTMFHPDGKRLLATHYCAAHNQPRMALVPGPKPNQITFDFIDGTNIGPKDGHMRRLVVTLIDADHHDEAWTYFDGTRELPPSVFKFTRRK